MAAAKPKVVVEDTAKTFRLDTEDSPAITARKTAPAIGPDGVAGAARWQFDAVPVASNTMVLASGIAGPTIDEADLEDVALRILVALAERNKAIAEASAKYDEAVKVTPQQ